MVLTTAKLNTCGCCKLFRMSRNCGLLQNGPECRRVTRYGVASCTRTILLETLPASGAVKMSCSWDHIMSGAGHVHYLGRQLRNSVLRNDLHAAVFAGGQWRALRDTIRSATITCELVL